MQKQTVNTDPKVNLPAMLLGLAAGAAPAEIKCLRRAECLVESMRSVSVNA